MSERDDAYGLASKILDRICGDPDDDLAILGRQLLRHKERIAQLEAEVARLNKVMDPIDQECCDLQEKWKAEAQWAAGELLRWAGYAGNEIEWPEDGQRAKRILDGQL